MYKVVAVVAVCFFMFILWVVYLANTGDNSIFFDFIGAIPYGDKFGHAGLFGFLTLLSVIAFKFRSFRIRRFRIYYGACLVLLFVVAEELSQIFIASRTFDFVDLASDVVGIVTATALCFLGGKHLEKSSSKDAASGAA